MSTSKNDVEELLNKKREAEDKIRSDEEARRIKLDKDVRTAELHKQAAKDRWPAKLSIFKECFESYSSKSSELALEFYQEESPSVAPMPYYKVSIKNKILDLQTAIMFKITDLDALILVVSHAKMNGESRSGRGESTIEPVPAKISSAFKKVVDQAMFWDGKKPLLTKF